MHDRPGNDHRPERVDFAAAILAGGKARRMGGMDKALVEIGGKTVLELIIERLQEVFSSIFLVLREEGRGPDGIFPSGVEVVYDLLKGKGPLVGIYTALECSRAPYVFFIACDMPYPNLDLVRLMLREAEGHEAVVPRWGDRMEPLFAVYSREVLEKIRIRLQQDDLTVYELYPELDVRYLEEEEIAACDPGFRSFFNINTIEDLRSACEL